MQETKDGIWFGPLPNNWAVGRIGKLYTERKTKVSDADFVPLSVTKMGVVPQLATAAKTDAHDDRKLVLKGDFAINSRSDRRGSCGISDFDGSVSLINTILTPREEMNPGYYNWLFHTAEFADEFYKWGHGIVDDLWTTNWSDMKRIAVPVPSLEIQQRIADYLDVKCAKIDAILEKTQASVEEYKKLKQSVITEAVTKGIRGERPLKDSGVDWIGEIPAEWAVQRFYWQNYIRGRLGWKGLKADEYVPEGYPFLSAFNIIDNHLDWSDLNFITKERYDESPEIKLSVGDLLIVKDGAGIGKCARIDELPLGEATVNSSLAVITPGELMDYKYEYYYLQGAPFQQVIWFLKIGMGVPHLTQEKMREISITCPPIPEQREIAAYLDKKCTVIDSLIASKEALISELENYKKSLIYEYVTGKKEV